MWGEDEVRYIGLEFGGGGEGKLDPIQRRKDWVRLYLDEKV